MSMYTARIAIYRLVWFAYVQQLTIVGLFLCILSLKHLVIYQNFVYNGHQCLYTLLALFVHYGFVLQDSYVTIFMSMLLHSHNTWREI